MNSNIVEDPLAASASLPVNDTPTAVEKTVPSPNSPIERTTSTLLQVQLSDPQKHQNGLQPSYMSYTLTTTLSSFKKFVVQRRYGDFRWLHERLQDLYPFVILPPLPGRHRLSYLDRFKTEFITRRQKALERYMNRILRLSSLELAQSTLLKTFLLQSQPLQHQQEEHHREVSSLDQKVKEWFGGSDSSLSVFADEKQNLQRAEDQLHVLLNCMQQSPPAYGFWAQLYRQWADGWFQLSNCSFSGWMGQSCTAMDHLLNELQTEEEENGLELMHEWLAYIQSALKTILRVDQQQMHVRSLQRELHQVELERSQLPTRRRSVSEIDFQMQQRRLEERYQQCQMTVEKARLEFTKIQNQVQHELKEFHLNRQVMVHQLLQDICQRHIQLHQQVTTTFSHLIHLLEKDASAA